MGKGSDQRPGNKTRYDESFERIFGKKDPMEYHRDKTRGLKISWPQHENKEMPPKRAVCTFCGASYRPGKDEAPCEHFKAFEEQHGSDWHKPRITDD